MVIMSLVVILDRFTSIPPYWLQPRTLAWLFVAALYILSAIYLALDDLAGVDIPAKQWLSLLVFGGLVLIGINRAFWFQSNIFLVIAEYSLVFAALLLWSLAISLIIAMNTVPPIHERIRLCCREIRDFFR